jgi:hypothetical protein
MRAAAAESFRERTDSNLASEGGIDRAGFMP